MRSSISRLGAAALLISAASGDDVVVAPSGGAVSAGSAPRKARSGTVRIKGPKDIMDTVIGRIMAGRPKGTGAKQIDFEVARSTKTILSKVRYVLSTGMEPLDKAIGIGGLPFGRVTELYGTDGSAKTAMALRCAIRMQQKFIYERVKVEGTDVRELNRVSLDVPIFTVFIDNEQSIDDDWQNENRRYSIGRGGGALRHGGPDV